MEKYFLILNFLLFLLVIDQVTPDSSCEYEEEVVPGRTYYVYSPNYPYNYTGPINCSWYAKAPSRSRIVLNCTSINIPKSNNCEQDSVKVSPTGNPADSHIYCGKGTFSVISDSNRMLITAVSPPNSIGGSFVCTLTATTQPNPPPPEACDCGWKKEVRIVGGVETGVNEYPMMAGLVNKVGLFCGATIISNRYCVTAAHCLLNKSPSDIAILVGDHDITNAQETQTAKLYKVQSFIGHPDYNSATQVNDIAILKTIEYITYSFEVGPACLPFRFPQGPLTGQSVQVLGWGTLEQAGEKSNVLMKTSLDVIDTQYCKRDFGDNKVSDKQICTFRSNTDACQADSGGPVIMEKPDHRVLLMGIISYGKGCAIQYPGVNTRIGAYLDWILKSTPDATYCVR